MNQIKVNKITKNFNTKINLPGSKSITLRDLALACLAKGESEIYNPADGDDARRMEEALKELGIKIKKIKSRAKGLKIFGQGGKFEPGEKRIYLGGSGTSTRILSTIVSLRKDKTIIDGDESLRSRPNTYLFTALKKMGVNIKSTNNGYLPAEFSGGKFKNEITMKGDISSQFFTSFMQIAPLLPNGLTIKVEGNLVSKPYIDITINEMKKFGVDVKNKNYQEFIIKRQPYGAAHVTVEGDASAASYFLALATIHGGTIIFKNLNQKSVQGDLNFYKICERLGAKVKLTKNFIKITGPKNGTLKPLKEIDMENMPDAAQTLMSIAPYIPGGVLITGIATLRLKECDRISAPAQELKKLGIKTEEGKDCIKIFEKKDFSGINTKKISIDTYNDHRMAMSFAVLGTKIGELKINNPDCVNKTFPNFWKELDSLY